MRPRWVIQQYIPKVENQKNRDAASIIEFGDGGKHVRLIIITVNYKYTQEGSF